MKNVFTEKLEIALRKLGECLYKRTLKMSSRNLQENFENIFAKKKALKTPLQECLCNKTLWTLSRKVSQMPCLYEKNFENVFAKFTRELWKCLREVYKRTLRMSLRKNFENAFTRNLWKCLCNKTFENVFAKKALKMLNRF